MSVAATEPLVVPLLYDPSFKGSILFSFHDSYSDLSDMHKTEKLKRVHAHVHQPSTLMQLFDFLCLTVYHSSNELFNI